ncbi:hypothetical protein [Telmatospirillum sp. J64-1]|uniref:hypothetical protein n=1 Tax=Telmatospirillum sp. J64-1 TaxID=2502183 RepID=UPI00115EADF6|nr:hypothetical protein [Telmatospirillum sp. J64-1]
MSDYTRYAAILRFVARKTDQSEERIAAMMEDLLKAADQIEQTGRFTVAPDHAASTARAFAGVAAFLQQQILPEAVAHGDKEAENQIRWTISAAMDGVNTLLAAMAEDQTKVIEVVVPDNPQ